MTPRERVLHAIHRQPPDKIPKEAGFTPAAFDKFREHTGSDDPATYFGMEPRSVGFRPPAALNDFSAYL